MANDLSEKRQVLDISPKKYDKALSRALDDIWDLLVSHVVAKLKELGFHSKSRIWWCPTSVLSALPLHAAGPITPTAPKSPKLYLTDEYISSYTPTLTALLQARSDAHLRSSDAPPSLLGVALLDDTLEAANTEVQVLKNHFAPPDMLSLAVGSECTRENVLAGLRERPWAHFTCHGVLEPGEPFNSAFILSNSDRITLLDIIKAGLHSAELAVLSACHTAEQTQGSATEEVLHLAAAMQFSGFRSVVGTMWQVQDEDGPTFAEHFYGAMFAGEGLANASEVGFKKAARAYCAATKQMRRKVNLERWVNFVHIGA